MSAPTARAATSAGHPQTRTRSTHFGATIRRRRLALGLEQDQLAQRLGWSRGSVGRVERAAFSPSLHRLFQLADALGEPLHLLLEDAAAEQALTEEGLR